MRDELRRILFTASVFVIGLVLAAGCAAPPELDAQGRRLLDPMREELLRPAALIERLALPEAAVVADIGAGPGLLTLPLARAVPRGRVIATDIRGDYLDWIRYRSHQEQLGNIATRLVSADAPGIAPASIDVALLCQVDQMLVDRAAYFRALRTALMPHGRIVIVNWERLHEANLAAARAASLRVVDEWSPTRSMRMTVLAAEEG